MATNERRKKKLIEPRLQLRFAAIFVTSAALAALVQTIVVTHLLLRVADGLESDGVALKSQMLDVLGGSLVITLLLLVPLTLAVGITATHKVVGPLYRFRVYLTELTSGANPGPCRIRDGDELQDLCELMNRATEPLRRPVAVPVEPLEKAA